jgi:large subunit ribosomal protein L22
VSVPVATEQERIRARARYVHSSARKARLVLEHIRGLSAEDAQAMLEFQPRAVARDAGKVLRSAIANAENNGAHEVEDLVVVAAYADEGPTLKRWRARARGRVNRIRKRTCHITIELAVVEREEDSRRPRRRPARTAAEPQPAPGPETAAAEPDEVEQAQDEPAAAEPEAAPPPEPEAVTQEAAPKPRRRTTKKAAPAPESAPAEGDEAPAQEAPEPEAAKPAPKPRRRTTKPKPAEPDAGAESEEASE